ncbi:hypothetical protein PM082_024730 [Marasmius tenuissimus]|nr:hypothetical protein PM082_024730 [Marasmius tenuissimus]
MTVASKQPNTGDSAGGEPFNGSIDPNLLVSSRPNTTQYDITCVVPKYHIHAHIDQVGRLGFDCYFDGETTERVWAVRPQSKL